MKGEDMMSVTNDDAKILGKMAALCSQKECCEKDIREKMEKLGADEQQQARIMKYLIDERYIDEERYCRGFVHDKKEYNRWGRVKIEQALYMKGVPRNVSSGILDEIDEDEWTDMLIPLLKQKHRTTKGRNAYEVSQKLMRFAVGRGFTFSQARSAMKALDIEAADSDEDMF